MDPLASRSVPNAGTNPFEEAVLTFAGSHGAQIILFQTESGLAAKAASTAFAAHPEARICYVHPDRAALRKAWQEAEQAGSKDRVLFYHGNLTGLLRDIPLAPSLAVLSTASEILPLWDSLAPGAILLLAEILPAAHAWEQSGVVERLPASTGFTALRFTGRHPGRIAHIPEETFQRLRVRINARSFINAQDSDRTTYTDLTTPARHAWIGDTAPIPRGWPFDRPEVSLPPTLPNGESWPLISLVTPSYQQGIYLEETILSVLHQGYPRVEHIVMDGGSTDSTPSVLRRYRSFLADATIEIDGGQSHAINKGMARSSGSILTWLNSDDMLAPGALAAVALGLHLSKVDMLAGIVTLMTGGRPSGHHLTSCEPGPLPLHDLLDLEGGWNAGKFFYQPEVMFTRDIWDRAGAMVREDLFYSMDYDLWVRYAEAGARLHVIGRPVALFRVHAEQKTAAREKFQAELAAYRADYLALHPSAASHGPTKATAPKTYQQSLRIALVNDHGFQQGAGVAHQRTAESLTAAGHTVKALALRDHPGTGRPHGDERDAAAVQWVLRAVEAFQPDLVLAGNLHSVGADPSLLETLAGRYPTLWCLHDFWILTGRCAYPGPCLKYRPQETGGNSPCDATCPTAAEYPSLAPELIHGAWQAKRKLLSTPSQLVLLANSDWAASVARQALPDSPTAIERFRLSYPLDRLRPSSRDASRRRLGLPLDRFVILVSGSVDDPRKQLSHVFKALASLRLPDVTVVSLGRRPAPGEVSHEECLELDVRRPGSIDDLDLLAVYYSAADLFVAPSAQETFGQVYIEAIACGTPVIGYRNSGVQEAILDGVTGWLVDEETPEALSAAILGLYRSPELRSSMAIWGRIYVENEWSPQAAYYHLFLAWRRLGLTARLGLAPKISFLPDAQEIPRTTTPQSRYGTTITRYDMGQPEGPLPELGLGEFRWAIAPISRLFIYSAAGGAHSLLFRYRNVLDGQSLRLRLNGQVLDEWAIPKTGMSEPRIFSAELPLEHGENVLEMEFSRWDSPGAETRRLALLLHGILCLPDRL